MLAEVNDNNYDYKIITDDKILTENEADVSKNHIFAEKYSNHAILNFEKVYANSKENYVISLHNPFSNKMTGSVE